MFGKRSEKDEIISSGPPKSRFDVHKVTRSKTPTKQESISKPDISKGNSKTPDISKSTLLAREVSPVTPKAI